MQWGGCQKSAAQRHAALAGMRHRLLFMAASETSHYESLGTQVIKAAAGGGLT